MAAEAVFSTILQELLSKLSDHVQNEIGLLWGLEEEKQKLESNLSVIRAVLHDAEKRQVNEMAVKDWLGKLKGAAYDAEDLVDEFIFEARRRKVVNQQGMQKKVRNFCSLSNPLAFRLKMAHKMQELRKRFDAIAKERNDFHFKEEAVESRPPISRTRETDSYVIESEVCGRKNEAEKLIHSLINYENEEVLSVIPIVGMGGMGKTTLAQLIFNDKRVGTDRFDLKMWVYVSEDFDVGRLLKEILQSAIKGEAGNLSIDLLHTRLRETLSGKKYLLVLDDVWNEEVNEWSRLKTWLKCGGKGSKILATTRSDKVAAIMGTLPAHKLGILSEKDSWTLFDTLARPHPNFVSMGKEIVGKCGGLPLAIKTLGSLMYSKTTQSEWESVRNSEFWNRRDSDGGVLPALRLSYDHLTPSLKQCFAYCAIIPKGSEVEKDKLIRQWIAQGFIHSDGENDLLEEKGEGYFNELLQSEESGAGIEELKGLNQLSGHIHIEGLDNIRNGVCAREANLKAKQYLSALELSWSVVDTVASASEEVIENLEPHPNLKKLIVNDYGFGVALK
ncbi:hypothetical protein AAC387_Pa11g2176 [Persea americana]